MTHQICDAGAFADDCQLAHRAVPESTPRADSEARGNVAAGALSFPDRVLSCWGKRFASFMVQDVSTVANSPEVFGPFNFEIFVSAKAAELLWQVKTGG